MTTEQELLSGLALTTFRLNGQLLDVAEQLARPAGLTAARWQVLGAVLHEPLTVAAIARRMGLARQSVQRTADLLVDSGLLERLPNPAHRRANLLQATASGLEAVGAITPQHGAFAARLADSVGPDALRRALDNLEQLSWALEALALEDVSRSASAAE
ncbi:MAG: MarR family transcriptional regulator [Acidimicrobiia bacterium]|nr:MarR family transcriptional regulator [Acidimicrobiia bacterium]